MLHIFPPKTTRVHPEKCANDTQTKFFQKLTNVKLKQESSSGNRFTGQKKAKLILYYLLLQNVNQNARLKVTTLRREIEL